ncbi:hypothetical protein AB1K62_02030 [Parasphingorhabdus sp. JC815]|uniref:hypothetical protein n=1 Tax=Parasphingorhabdus sp. JC815 TaxID=3232140 RepID=UPI003457F51B
MVAFFLASCDQAGEQQEGEDSIPPGLSQKLPVLEQAAIDAGIIPDVRNMSLSGAFERRSDLGEDRFCAVGNDEHGYQVGLLAVFGPDSKCEAMGAAERAGENVRITLNSRTVGEEKCIFDASFDGVSLRFPGILPTSCNSYCTPPAVLDGVSFYLVGEGNAVARSTRGREIENLCPGQ